MVFRNLSGTLFGQLSFHYTLSLEENRTLLQRYSLFAIATPIMHAENDSNAEIHFKMLFQCKQVVS